MRAAWTEPIPVRRVEPDPDSPAPHNAWPATLPPVRQVLEDGLELARATILIGENGSGKSTLIEAIALAYGLAPEGGGTGSMHSSHHSESDLHTHLRLVRGAGASRWGYFVRAETMHGLFSYLATSGGDGAALHRLSHGESFLSLVADPHRFGSGGLFLLDEPEAGLSFSAQLTLLGELRAMAEHPRGQVVLATHSPVIAALPGARLLQLDSRGITETGWDELDVVDHYRRFVDQPRAYLRHLFG